MDSRQQVELTIRTAQLGKACMDLVGTKDVKLARMKLAGIVAEVRDLDGFLDSVEAATK